MSRLPRLIAVGAVAGVALGAGLHWAGVGQRPMPRLHRAPPAPSGLPTPTPAPAPEATPPPPVLPFRLSSLLPPTREAVAWLQLEVDEPARLRILLRRPGRPDQDLFDAGERRLQATVPIPPLPVGVEATLVVEAPEFETPYRLALRGRPAEVQVRAEEGPPVSGLGSDVDRAFLLLGARDLRVIRDDATPGPRRQLAEDLRGAPFLRRGRVILAGPGRDVRAFDADTLEPRWRARLPGAARWPPLEVEPFQVAFLSDGLHGPVLQCIEASRGVPMWEAPRPITGPLPVGSHPIGGGRRLLVPVAPARLQVWSLFGDAIAAELSQVVAGRITTPVATSPREWRSAIGSDTGRVRTLDMVSRRTLRDRGRPAGNELLPAEIHAQPTLLPVRRLHFIDLHRLLVLTDEELLLLNASGGVNWRTGLPAPPAHGPAVVPGRIVLGLEGGQVAHFSRVDGELLELEPGAALVPGSLESREGPVRWARRDGRVTRLVGGGFPAVDRVSAGPLAEARPADPAP